jgi:hypothetical protein
MLLSMGLHVYSLIVARQQLGKLFPQRQGNIVGVVHMRSMSCQKKVDDLFFPELTSCVCVNLYR